MFDCVVGGVWVGTVGAGGLGRPDWVEGWVLGGGAAAPCVGCSLKRGREMGEEGEDDGGGERGEGRNVGGRERGRKGRERK